MSSLLIENGYVVTMDPSKESGFYNIYIEGDTIKSVSKERPDADEIIDARGKVAIPGLINTHTHVAMSHLKGMLDDIDLDNFLRKTFELDSNRTDEGLYNSSLLGIYEMMNAGITSFHDLYYSEDVIARAAENAGMRAFLSWVVLDEEYTTQKGSPLKNAEAFIHSRGSSLVSRSIGIQGVYVAGEETYLRAKEIAERYDTTIHTHLAETRKEVYDLVKSRQKRPIEYLDSIGFLNDRVIAAHCVWSTLHEVKLLAKNDVKVSWNPTSNAKLGVGGVPPIPEMIDNGVTVSLGTDSSGSNNSLNLIQEAKFGALSVKNQRWDASKITAYQVLEMATVNAAKSLRREDLGSIGAGKKADIVLIDNRSPNMHSDLDRVVNNIVYASNPSNVSDVLINGRIVKREGKLLSYDPDHFEGATFF